VFALQGGLLCLCVPACACMCAWFDCFVPLIVCVWRVVDCFWGWSVTEERLCVGREGAIGSRDMFRVMCGCFMGYVRKTGCARVYGAWMWRADRRRYGCAWWWLGCV
jgi:hypothetical protein